MYTSTLRLSSLYTDNGSINYGLRACMRANNAWVSIRRFRIHCVQLVMYTLSIKPVLRWGADNIIMNIIYLYM